MKMFMEERRNKILELLGNQQRITVKELSKELEVSEATLRNDLKDMEKGGFLKRTHGGAVLSDLEDNKVNFSVREKVNKAEKHYISTKAEQLIEENQCILIDASSTGLELARKIKHLPKRLTIVTNGIYTALELRDNPDFIVIVIGGVLRAGSSALESTISGDLLNKINIDTMFTSASGFDFENGLTDFNMYEVELKKMMVNASNRVVALLDHTKFNKKSIASFAALHDIHMIITDDDIPNEDVEKLKEFNIEYM